RRPLGGRLATTPAPARQARGHLRLSNALARAAVLDRLFRNLAPLLRSEIDDRGVLLPPLLGAHPRDQPAHMTSYRRNEQQRAQRVRNKARKYQKNTPEHRAEPG